MKNWKPVVAVFVGVAIVVFAVFAIVGQGANYQASVARSNSVYNVTNGSSGFVIHGIAYTTTNGQVTLPDNDYPYFADLVTAGVLKNALAPNGGTIFVNSSSMVAGPSAVVDLQSGSVVTLNTTVTGAPTFSGAVTGSGGFVGNLTGNSAGVHTGNVVGNLNGDLTKAAAAAVTINATGNITTGGDFVGDLLGAVHGPVILAGKTYSVSPPITVTGWLTNVQILYTQLP